MIVRYAIALAVLLILAVAVRWAFLPARYLPGNRARYLRVRMHLRLHPGKGFAHVFSLWLRWSRFAALRRSARIRRSLPLCYRILEGMGSGLRDRSTNARQACMPIPFSPSATPLPTSRSPRAGAGPVVVRLTQSEVSATGTASAISGFRPGVCYWWRLAWRMPIVTEQHAIVSRNAVLRST